MTNDDDEDDDGAGRVFLAISGPTGSGKSDLSLFLAAKFNAEIVSVDSVQVYKDFNIGSAKPSTDTQKKIRHHLLDVAAPSEQYDAGRFVVEADKAIADIQARHKIPLLVGGTTLYLSAFFSGLADSPRDYELRTQLSQMSSEDLMKYLVQLDAPLAARLHINDRVRVQRGVELALLTKKPSSKRFSTEVCRRKGLILVLMPERALLHRRIEKRSGEMLKNGLVEETEKIVSLYGLELAALKTIGYKESSSYLEGSLSSSELQEAITQSTRQLAKRQITFWCNEPRKRGWRATPEQSQTRKANQEKIVLAHLLSIQDLDKQIKERLEQPFYDTEVWYLDLNDRP